jgi:hypothetical protein
MRGVIGVGGREKDGESLKIQGKLTGSKLDTDRQSPRANMRNHLYSVSGIFNICASLSAICIEGLRCSASILRMVIVAQWI